MSEDNGIESAVYLRKWKVGPVRYSRSYIRRTEGEVYLSRWILEFGKSCWSIRLHVFANPDADFCLHDHPWWFLTFVLWGGYIEEFTEERALAHNGTLPQTKLRIVRWLGYRPRNFKHRIVALLRRRVVTIILTGPISREWGFYTNEGWRPWQHFVNLSMKTRALWCHSPATHDGRDAA